MTLEKGRFYLSDLAGLVSVGENFGGSLVLHSFTFGTEIINADENDLKKYGVLEKIPDYRARELIEGLSGIKLEWY